METTTAARTAQPGDTCTHPSFRGQALYFRRYKTERRPIQYLIEEEDEHGEIVERWEEDYSETEEVEDQDQAIVVMIGDDREHTVDTEDLIILEEDEDGSPAYCTGCGSTTCMHTR